jgi:hypothetical protein
MFCIVLVCCRSLVRIVVQRGGIKQRWNFSLCRCVRTHILRLNVHPTFDRRYFPSAREVRVALAGPIVHCFNLAPWAVICVRTHLHSNARGTALQLRPNAHPEERTHARVRSNAQPVFECTPDLAAHFILSINRTLCILCFSCFGRCL